MHYFQNYYGNWMMPMGGFLFAPIIGMLLFVIVVWSLIWKGMALWRAARQGEKIWFVVLLVANTAGILDILYLYIFSKKSKPIDHS